MHDNIYPLQCVRRTPKSRGFQLRAIATDEHYRRIALEAALRRARESLAEIALPLYADLNTPWDGDVAPTGVGDRRRCAQFHRTDFSTNGTLKSCFEHTPCQ